MPSSENELKFGDPTLISAHDKNSLELIDAYACSIDPKSCSALLGKLSDIAPLRAINHAKRIRKNPTDKTKSDILIMPVYKEDAVDEESEEMDLDKQENAQDNNMFHRQLAPSSSASGNLSLDNLPVPVAELLKPFTESVFVVQVARYAPHNKADQAQWGKHWPVSTRPLNKIALRDHAELSPEEITTIKDNMAKTYALAQEHAVHAGNVCNACVIVDPESNTVLGTGVDDTTGTVGHPLHHAVMNAVEAVASWQRKTFYGEGSGGEEKIIPETTEEKEEAREEDFAEELNGGENSAEGEVPKKRNRKRKKFNDESAVPEGTVDQPASVETIPSDEIPYLCTGYDCYVVQEPCAMCAMALVHSRLRRVIFCHSDRKGGALGGSGLKLHSKRTLNHHYSVFRILRID